jgi:hypothetical protein
MGPDRFPGDSDGRHPTPVGRSAFALFNKMEVIENTPVFFAENSQIFGGSESRRFRLF